jgi:TPP-dependent 2-oxoacid decarboxylase
VATRFAHATLSIVLGRAQKPIILLVNNNGYTIERLLPGPGSGCNDIDQWRYEDAASSSPRSGDRFQGLGRRIGGALATACDQEGFVQIELVMSRLDAPGSLVNSCSELRREFAFPNSRPF